MSSVATWSSTQRARPPQKSVSRSASSPSSLTNTVATKADMKAQLAAWQQEKSAAGRKESTADRKKADEEFLYAKKTCRGSECSTAVKIFCKQENLDAKNRNELSAFMKWVQSQYNIQDNDALTFCQVWNENMKKRSLGRSG